VFDLFYYGAFAVVSKAMEVDAVVFRINNIDVAYFLLLVFFFNSCFIDCNEKTQQCLSPTTLLSR
jgi:hypothetical protein